MTYSLLLLDLAMIAVPPLCGAALVYVVDCTDE